MDTHSNEIEIPNLKKELRDVNSTAFNIKRDDHWRSLRDFSKAREQVDVRFSKWGTFVVGGLLALLATSESDLLFSVEVTKEIIQFANIAGVFMSLAWFGDKFQYLIRAKATKKLLCELYSNVGFSSPCGEEDSLVRELLGRWSWILSVRHASLPTVFAIIHIAILISISFKFF